MAQTRMEGTEDAASRRQFLKEGAAAGLALAWMGGVASAQTNDAGTGQAGADAAIGKMTQGGLALYPGAVNAQGEYVLPPLPYAYDALEPTIDQETLKLHHDKHHAAYVKGLNEAQAELAGELEKDDFALVEHWLRKASFNGGGHVLHCIYWASLSPKPGKPSAELQQAINEGFGSQEKFEKMLVSASKSIEGSGWGCLCWSIPAKRLIIQPVLNHNHLSQWANVPLLVTDVWEHAYYKKYSNDRGAYLSALMKIINWEGVSARYDTVRRMFD